MLHIAVAFPDNKTGNLSIAYRKHVMFYLYQKLRQDSHPALELFSTNTFIY